MPEMPQHIPAPSVDAEGFKQAMTRFCSGVTVITATTESAGIHGMTATAFSSLSLSPPLVLVCVDVAARMHQVLSQVTACGISILSHDQQHVSAAFAGKAVVEKTPLIWRGDVPVVANALAQMVGRIVARYDGGDHTIFVIRVTGCWTVSGEPLLYYGGRYRSLNLD